MFIVKVIDPSREENCKLYLCKSFVWQTNRQDKGKQTNKQKTNQKPKQKKTTTTPQQCPDRDGTGLSLLSFTPLFVLISNN